MAGHAGRSAIGWVTLHLLPGVRSRLLKSWTQGGVNLEGGMRWWFDALSESLDREYFADSTSTARREALKTLCMGTRRHCTA